MTSTCTLTWVRLLIRPRCAPRSRLTHPPQITLVPGYGLMAARAAVLEIDPNGPEDDSHPCIHDGYTGKYTYGEEVYQAQGNQAQYDQCMATVLTALNRDEKCGAPQPQCSFQGAWRGSRIPDVFYVSSYFWDRAADAGILDDDKDTHAVVSPRHFKDVAEDACDLDVKSVQSKFSRIQKEHSPYFCLDLTYAHTLLTGGFNIPEEQEITLVKKVKYHGDYVEVAWYVLLLLQEKTGLGGSRGPSVSLSPSRVDRSLTRAPRSPSSHTPGRSAPASTCCRDVT